MRTTNHAIDAVGGLIIGRRGTPLRKKMNGYVMARYRNKWFAAHRLIWESVHGQIPDGMQINHKNGIKHDNRLANLELVTPSQNTAHAYRIGLTSAVGERNGRAKITALQAREIRCSSESARECSERFGISTRTVYDIRTGVKWSKA